MPQMTVVAPILTRADPSAFEIESLLMIVGRNSSNSRPSLRTDFSR